MTRGRKGQTSIGRRRLAKFGAEHFPDALLRPFLMGFVTTALGVEANLYRHGAMLVNMQGRRFADELAAPAGQASSAMALGGGTQRA